MKSVLEKSEERRAKLIEFIKSEVKILESTLTNRIRNYEDGTFLKRNEFITQKKAANLLGISVPTFRKYTKMGVFKQHQLGTKVYYRQDEIYNACKQINL